MLSIVSKAHSYKSDDVQFTYLRPISVKSSFLGPTFRTNFLGVKGFCFKARIFCTGLLVGSIESRTPVSMRVGRPFVDNGGLSGFKLALEIG